MGSVRLTTHPDARAQWQTSARSSELLREGKESGAFFTMRSFAGVVLLLGLAGAMEIGKGGVYDSPMAQADGLVAEGGKVEPKAPAEEMRNSVDTYYTAVLP